jgi:O-antigen ligase
VSRADVIRSPRADRVPWTVSATLFVLIGLVFFYRGTVFTGLSISIVIPVMAIISAATVLLPSVYRTGRFPAIAPAPAGLFMAWLGTVLITAALHPSEAITIYRFGTELLLNVLLFYLALTLARSAQATDHVFTLIIVASVPLGVAMLLLARQIEFVRRIGAADAHLGAAVDHLGHAFAIAVIACVYKLLRRRDVPVGITGRVALLGALVLATAGVLLSGSKAALAAVLVFVCGLALVGVLRQRRFVVRLAVGMAALGALVGLAYMTSEGKFVPLGSRFAPQSFIGGVGERLSAMRSAGRGVGPGDLILGMPWRYEPLNPDWPIRYPHNVLWSMWLHTGVVSFVIFGYILASRFWQLLARAFTAKRGWFMPFILTAMLVTTVLYGSTSGRLTRIMTIFFVLGLADGYLMRLRRSG